MCPCSNPQFAVEGGGCGLRGWTAAVHNSALHKLDIRSAILLFSYHSIGRYFDDVGMAGTHPHLIYIYFWQADDSYYPKFINGNQKLT
jgi:hypothetical protein